MGGRADHLLIGGPVGCKKDGYKPEEVLSKDEATDLALAMSATGLPDIISFMINRDGRILDGWDDTTIPLPHGHSSTALSTEGDRCHRKNQRARPLRHRPLTY